MREKHSYGQAPTCVSAEAEFKGTLRSEGDVIICGTVIGQVTALGKVIIEKDAKVHSQIEGSQVQVAGRVKGNVEAKDRLDILSTGSIRGDIATPVLSIEQGATIDGQCSMVEKEEKIEGKNGKALGGATAKEEAIQILMGTRESAYAQKQKIPKNQN